jgi:four helix bundle protein
MSEFRFENLEIWQRSSHLAYDIFDLAEKLDEKRLYRFAEQFRAAGLSIPNNIAEGSGSSSKQDFKHFLNIARRSVFECASMLIMFNSRKLLDKNLKPELLNNLDQLSRMIHAFRKSLE